MTTELAIRRFGSEVDVDRDRRLRSMVNDHFDTIWRSLKRLGVPEGTVDDAVQQVFLVASRKLLEIEPGRERCYLLGVAVRVASDVRHAVQRRREVPLDDALLPSGPGALPDQTLDEKRARAVLATVLDSMPSDMREAFVLFELEEFTAVEVAAVLGVAVGTVASRVRRARDHVRRHLARRGGPP
jgi:RNA polymerase sigma-70 factor (ECF subfamily)